MLKYSGHSVLGGFRVRSQVGFLVCGIRLDAVLDSNQTLVVVVGACAGNPGQGTIVVALGLESGGIVLL